MKSALRKSIINLLIKSGRSYFSAIFFYDALLGDFLKERRATLTQKLWAYRRGFLSSRIPYYGLTEDNYRDYLSDFDYACLYPINGPFNRWIDDKLTFRYMLAPFSQYLPKYYFHLYQGEILRLADCPEEYEASTLGMIGLLKKQGSLAVKLVQGTKGKGFHKLEYSEGNFYFDKHPVSENETTQLFAGWLDSRKSEYLLTEYLMPHSELKKTWAEAPSALRLMVGRMRGFTPRLMLSFQHFATKKTGVLNTPGGVSCIVDVKTGYYSNGKSHGPDGLIDTPFHPDSGIPLEGYLPHWQLIVEKIVEISSFIPQVRYMGYDAVVTEDGFKIIEINSHPSLDYLQAFHPVMREEITRGFFQELLEEKRAR